MKKTIAFIVCSAILCLAAGLPAAASAVMYSRPHWLHPDAIVFSTIMLMLMLVFWFLFTLITYIESL